VTPLDRILLMSCRPHRDMHHLVVAECSWTRGLPKLTESAVPLPAAFRENFQQVSLGPEAEIARLVVSASEIVASDVRSGLHHSDSR
jgi:hypothetical protein